MEREFAAQLDSREDIRVFAKLPSWFQIDTPVGKYNPDWAIVITKLDEHQRAQDTLYLVAETKSTANKDKLRPDERRKIACGERHFARALHVPYKQVTTASELP